MKLENYDLYDYELLKKKSQEMEDQDLKAQLELNKDLIAKEVPKYFQVKMQAWVKIILFFP